VRFLFVTQYFTPEGGAAPVRLDAVTRELVKAGHQVRVVTALPSYPTERIFDGYRHRLARSEKRGLVSIRRVWAQPGMGTGVKRVVGYLSFAVTSFVALLFEARPDVAIVETPPLTAALSALVWCRLRRVPSILNVADLWPDSIVDLRLGRNGIGVRALGVLERWCYRLATGICSVTRGIESSLITTKGVTPARLSFLPNGVDVDLFRHATRQPSDQWPFRFTMIHPGTMALAHGLNNVIEAMQIVSETDPSIGLVFVGGGSERSRVEDQIRTLGLHNVITVDFVPLTRVAELLKSVDAGLVSVQDIPVMHGARPAKMFPMLAAGLPIVFCGRGEGADLVRSTGSGIVVDPDNPAALAQTIITLASDPDEQARLRAASDAAADTFEWSTLVHSWLGEIRTFLR
jgi:colanic acid biosynthesis glycosyl transferase WcaI